ncbi:hypothetical protein HYT04_03040, partial [Candidatus Kaiserbacteria bacterium]|nr:hypothetical protein [Candidatus Kaiserbacteria bacterium]
SAEFERLWKDECPDEHCGFRGPSQVVGQPVQLMGSYIPEPGEHVLRLPASVAASGSKYVTGVCLERVKMPWPEKPTLTYSHERREEYIKLRDEYIAQRDKWVGGHSDTIGIRPQDYRVTDTGAVATVYYTKANVPPGMPVLYIPWGEWMKLHPEWKQR